MVTSGVVESLAAWHDALAPVQSPIGARRCHPSCPDPPNWAADWGLLLLGDHCQLVLVREEVEVVKGVIVGLLVKDVVVAHVRLLIHGTIILVLIPLVVT
ncbi:hypothetical protein QYE76_070250 [Lolium multiflorum]|uniref:Uncharacterized protein n=1 Tax=Lolium multiflorum TaxID=4521 RepID=A0AAD8WEA0_LOLMU|nr:hypothetical protein QYE76_070250 [Lolium multiflorum]